MDVLLEVGSQYRELAEGRVDDVVLQSGVSVQHHADQGQQHQQQGEHGQKGGVGDLGGQLAGLVVGVLAHHRTGDSGHRSALLEMVHTVDGPGDAVGDAAPAGAGRRRGAARWLSRRQGARGGAARYSARNDRRSDSSMGR